MPDPKVTTHTLLTMKAKGRPIVMLTAYDAPTARRLSEAGVDCLLVGDSVGNVKLGYANTLPVTIEEILHHTKAAARGNTRSFLIADMPYLSYEHDAMEAARNAGRLVKEGGAHAVKVEGGIEIAPMIKEITRVNIPVVGHLGLTPQAVHRLGGYRVQGKSQRDADKLLTDAKVLEGAGVCMIVLEAVPAELARQVTEKVAVPTIGIGAGAGCDGQVLVVDDLLGLTPKPTPKFVKRYAELGEQMDKAVAEYVEDVRAGRFPTPDHAYT